MRVSVIVPVLNERHAIEPLVESLREQTRMPDEIVIADGGSTDGTRDILRRLQESEPTLKVVDGPGGIAENRNAAIRVATGEVIACTDAGCVPDPHWLEALTAPFAEGAQWVAGFYRPEGRTTASTAAGAAMMRVREEVDMDNYIPGGGSQAFLKTAWDRAGGFPEGMNAGEDTLFGEHMRARGYSPVFAPDATVAWTPPALLGEMINKAHRWGWADGINRLRTGAYVRVVAVYWGLPLLAVLAWLWRWWLGLFFLLLWLGAIAIRTRYKYRWVRGWSKWFLVPVAHVLQQSSQSAGWLRGYGVRNLLKRVAARLLGPLQRLFPGALGRSSERPSPPRHNVDLIVDDPSQAQEWLDKLPDTYRVVSNSLQAGPLVKATVEARPGSEPLVAPLAVTLTEEIEREIGADPGMLTDPVAAYSLLRQTGSRYRIQPTRGGTSMRKDRIEGVGSVVVLAAVPLHDVGGGSRGAQLAQEFASRGFHVTSVNRYAAGESVDLGLRFIHPRLEETELAGFDLGTYVGREPASPRVALVEFPHRDFIAIVDVLRKHGFKIVFDLIDDWSDPALGGWWWDARSEQRLIEEADLLVASAASLAMKLTSQARRQVIEVPNAVNARVFSDTGTFERPVDLPGGEGPVFHYHGSLYGDWFDWDAVVRIAEAFPDGRVVLIGDPLKDVPKLPANVHLLGLKPQSELPRYLSYADVALIPFKISKTTHAVSPLKVYEYLAMGVSVAASPLEPLADLQGVSTNTDLVEAVKAAMAAPKPDARAAREKHGWSERVKQITDALGWEFPPVSRPVEIKVRPVKHYRDGERLISPPAEAGGEK